MTPSIVSLLVAGCVLEPGTKKNPEREVVVTTTAEPHTASQAFLTVDLSAPAKVAAACVRRDEPTEVHLVEGEGTDSVVLRFAGLLHGTDYDCNVAAIDPGGPVERVSFRTLDPLGNIPSADVIADPGVDMTGAYTIMNARSECDGSERNAISVLDPEGNNRFYHPLPGAMNIGVEITLDGPNRFIWGGGKSENGAPAIVDVFDGEIWKLSFPGSDQLEFHHDGHRIADGRILSVADTYEPGWAAFQLRLHDDEGNVTWMWDVQQAVETGWLDAGDEDSIDPHHLNWADVVETDRGLVAVGSLCYDFKVIAVDVASGQPLWRFGYGGDFELTDAEGHVLEEQEDFPQCQHGLMTDGEYLLMYDNGFNRGYTRAVEYKLDLDKGTATKTWEWLDEGFFEKYHGGTDWLTPERDRILVVQGNNDCGDDSDRHSQIVEVDRNTDQPVHRLVLRDIGHWLYRAHRVDGCDLFANARWCPAIADRVEVLRPKLDL